MDKNYWMPEARQIAAQCWSDKETENIEMDVVLAESVAKRICNWMETAAIYSRNVEYYRGLLIKCGEIIGDSAYICDDGSKSEDVLCAKIPELVKDLVEKSKTPEYEVLMSYREVGADIVFRGTLEECKRFCEEEYKGSPYNDPDCLFYGDEDSMCEIFKIK